MADNACSAAARTDTSIATDKNTTITGVTTDTSVTSMRPIAPEDGASSSHHDPTDPEIGIFPPLKRFSMPERRLSSSSLNIPKEIEKALRRKSGSGASGTRSPMFDGGSSISSLEDAGFDTDILTDKMGFLELDASCSKMNHSSSTSLHLHTVAERLSDETLEDTHAFTDIKDRSTGRNGGNPITAGGENAAALEPLDEIDDEDAADGAVTITNLVEIMEVVDEEESPNGSQELPAAPGSGKK